MIRIAFSKFDIADLRMWLGGEKITSYVRL